MSRKPVPRLTKMSGTFLNAACGGPEGASLRDETSNHVTGGPNSGHEHRRHRDSGDTILPEQNGAAFALPARVSARDGAHAFPAKSPGSWGSGD